MGRDKGPCPQARTSSRRRRSSTAGASASDELLDAWEHGREHNSEQYTLFYDIKQAYSTDSVQRDVLARAMRCLRMLVLLILLSIA
jgi:hypothetical protein